MPLLERYLSNYVEVEITMLDEEINLATIFVGDREHYITATRVVQTQNHAYISIDDYLLLSSNG
jgi:hypothetical protein